VGDDHSDRLGPEGSEQAKVYKGAEMEVKSIIRN